MLSILIPSYGYNCLSFVTELHHQAEIFPVPTEILVAGGGAYVEENRRINNLKNAKFIEVSGNHDHSYIYSCLAFSARYDKLIFIGCDAGVYSDVFLKTYLINYRKDEVLCGGFVYDKPMPSPLFSLCWNYGSRRKEKTNLFSSFNYMINKDVCRRILLDNNLKWKDYRMSVHDMLMGDYLLESGIRVRRIDNPVYRLNLKKNDDFLKDTRENIKQLALVINDLKSESHLVHLYHKYKRNGLIKLVPITYNIFHKLIVNNLLGAHPVMKLYYFYELAHLCEELKQK